MRRITVRVIPRASRDEVVREDGDGVLHVRVTAPPVDGAANVSVAKVLAAHFGVPPRDIILVSGASARTKVFEVR